MPRAFYYHHINLTVCCKSFLPRNTSQTHPAKDVTLHQINILISMAIRKLRTICNSSLKWKVVCYQLTCRLTDTMPPTTPASSALASKCTPQCHYHFIRGCAQCVDQAFLTNYRALTWRQLIFHTNREMANYAIMVYQANNRPAERWRGLMIVYE